MLQRPTAKATLEEARKAMCDVIDKVTHLHVVNDLTPWLGSAYTTLVADSTLPRIPGFDIATLKPHKTATPRLTVAMAFVESTWGMSDHVKALAENSDPRNVCKSVESWMLACDNLIKADPAAEAALVPVTVKVRGMVETFCKGRLQDSLSQSVSLLGAYISKSCLEAPSKAAIDSSLEGCDTASLLATSFTDAEARRDWQAAIRLVRNLVVYTTTATATDHMATITSFKRLASDCQLNLATLDILDMRIEVNTFLAVAHVAYRLLYGANPDGSDDRTVSLEKFAGFLDAWFGH